MELPSVEREKNVEQVLGGDVEENQFHFGHVKFEMSIPDPGGDSK